MAYAKKGTLLIELTVESHAAVSRIFAATQSSRKSPPTQPKDPSSNPPPQFRRKYTTEFHHMLMPRPQANTPRNATFHEK